MISLVKRNGKLNILLTKLNFDLFVDIAFFWMLAALFCINSNANYLYYIGFFAFVGLTVVKVIMRLKYDGIVNIPAIVWWYLAFALFSLASVIWSEYPDVSIRIMTRMVQILSIVFCMSQNYATKPGFSRCMKIVCWSGVFCALYIFIRTPMDRWFNGALGGAVTGINVNIIGMIFVICALFTLYYANYRKKRLYYVLLFIEIMLIILTSSRKSIIVVLFSCFVLIVIKKFDYKMMFRFIIALALVAFGFYSVMNSELLFTAVGRRFESMFEYITSEGGDYSLYARDLFIDYARKFFLERPVLGSGVSTFIRKLGSEIGIYAYAHNNYYELLVGVGIIGFSIYYSFYGYLVAKLARMSFLYGDGLAKIMLMVMASLIICEYGIVVYYYVYAFVFICMAYLYVCVFDNEHGVKRYFMKKSSQLLESGCYIQRKEFGKNGY